MEILFTILSGFYIFLSQFMSSFCWTISSISFLWNYMWVVSFFDILYVWKFLLLNLIDSLDEYGILCWKLSLKTLKLGFSGGRVVKNPPAKAGDMGSIPAQGRSHTHKATEPVCHNYWGCALEPMCHSCWCPHVLEPVLCNKRSHHGEKPKHGN